MNGRPSRMIQIELSALYLRLWRGILLVLTLFCLVGCASTPVLEGLPESSHSSYDPIRNMSTGLTHLVDRKSQVALALGGAAVLVAKPWDGDANVYFSGQKRIGRLNWLGNEILGSGMPGFLLGGGFWLWGEFAGRPYTRHAGQAQVEALLLTGGLTMLAKSLSDRKRPDGSDHYSFPSGHTAYAFTTAAVLNEFYGWKVGVPAFGLGMLTAAGRMQDNRHWLSDTVAGAVLAVVIGRAVSRAHLLEYDKSNRASNSSASRLRVSPTFTASGGGVVLDWDF